MNCIYWTKKYPRLITKEFLKDNYSSNYKLQTIGDISVDINEISEDLELKECLSSSDNRDKASFIKVLSVSSN